jgi:hypothetical protein
MMPTRGFFFKPKFCTFTLHISCFLLLILLLFSTELASAQILNIQKIHCSLSKDDTETITKIARYEAAFYNAVFETSKNDSLPINIHIFGRKADFKETPDGLNALRVASDGYYLESSGEVFVLKTEHINAALLHEISHGFLHNNIQHPPKWFDEGLATYFGSLIIQNNQIFYTPVTGRIERIRELNNKQQLYLADFLKNNSRNWGDEQKLITDKYTIAYSIIYFLIKTNLNLVKLLADELKAGRPSIAVLADMFGGYAFFESRYIQFYKQQN